MPFSGKAWRFVIWISETFKGSAIARAALYSILAFHGRMGGIWARQPPFMCVRSVGLNIPDGRGNV